MEQSSYKIGGQKTEVSCLDEKSSHLEKDHTCDAVVDGSREFNPAGPEGADDKEKAIADHHEDAKSAPGAENNRQRPRKRKKNTQRVEPRTYALRSSLPKENDKTSHEQLVSTSNPIVKRRRKKKNQKNVVNDEFSLIKKRIRYLFNRISYEQNLIDAYSSEGWKGLSLEKIRPEKELERAKSEILRRKLRIRESFHHLDSLLSEGKLEENLFDEDGEIDSENISCAKCGSKESSSHNDIILCDGICDRGFHQKCLDPPLPTHLIPPGDQSWLCPACDCKLDCLQLLNEYQGCNLFIEDTWEKVFPEAAAANGNNQFDDSNYPTDDSEDDDYNPDVPEFTNEDQEEGSSSHESSTEESSEELDSTSASEDSEPPKLSNVGVLGLPSDDSEDDDYDPERADPNKDIQDKGLESSESDFTSDSDDFCAELSKITNLDDVTSSFLLETNMADRSGEGSNVRHKDPINSGLPPVVEADLGLENSCSMSERRQRERLDYKKLYDEAYAKASSDSSEDEEWNEKSTAKKSKKDNNRKAYATLPDATTPQSLITQRSSGIKHIVDVHSDHSQVSRVMKDSTQKRRHRYSGEQHVSDHSYGANGSKASIPVRRRHFDQNELQRLQEIFAENQYPTRQMKENLAEELGLTMKQIGKWFEKSRSSMRTSTTMGSHLPGTSTVSRGETNRPGTASPDKQALNKPSRKNNNSSKGNTNNATAKGNNDDKIPNKANNRKNQVGDTIIRVNDKPKRTLDYDRQKAVERELRRMKKHR